MKFMTDLNSTLLLAVVAAIWAAFNVLITTQKQINDMRNTIVIGKVGNDPITIQFRRHMLANDWVPASIVVTVISFAFGLAILLAPLLIESEKRSSLLWVFCLLFSLVPFLATVAWIVGGYQDYKYIRQELEQAEKAGEKAPQP
jgi:hypothetical protein